MIVTDWKSIQRWQFFSVIKHNILYTYTYAHVHWHMKLQNPQRTQNLNLLTQLSFLASKHVKADIRFKFSAVFHNSKFKFNNTELEWSHTIGPDTFAIRWTFWQSERQHQILKTADVEYCRSGHGSHDKLAHLGIWCNVPEHDIAH